MSAVLALGPWTLAFIALAVLLGTMLQRLAGQGFGMIAAPLVALVAPEFLPATLLLIGLVVGMTSATLDASAIRWADVPSGFAGRALGAALAAAVATRLSDPQMLAAVVAGAIYLGIALSLIGVRVAIRPATLFPAGVVAGVMGTLTAVGAPPMALLYQHEPARRSAAMQNLFFFFGMFVSLAALGAVGLINTRHAALAGVMLPVVAVALLGAQRLAPRVQRAEIRPWPPSC
ncbi:MAG: TSUP family transporter [Rhodobacteraceae bacterium]|nr:TSUP family transporter [Paracoccaceae bacterium]